jgi:hypothetical protein
MTWSENFLIAGVSTTLAAIGTVFIMSIVQVAFGL